MTSRLVAIAALVAGVIAVAVILKGGSSYTVNARFVDAGQLVKGGLVEVGGRSVGTTGEITLAPDGTANIPLKITDKEYQPLRRGTVARVRTVGLSGIANRFVELTPGPSTGERIADGATLTTAETRPIIDLDVLFNSLDPPTRGHLQSIIRNGAQLFAGTAQDANTAFGYLAPALAQSDQLASELALDRAAVDRLVRAGATTASALAAERGDLSSGITSTATTLRAIASEREAVAHTLDRAPPLLADPDRLYGELRRTLDQARPALIEARPVTPRLARVLKLFVPTAREAVPVLRKTRRLLPSLSSALRGLPPLAKVAVPALRATTTSLIAAMPIVDGLRPYAPELIDGFFSGLGRAAGYYDANGHYARIGLQGGSTALSGLLGGLVGPGAVNAADLRHKLYARCAGGAVTPAKDNSNPYIEDASVCNPADDAK
ncbi:MAG: phospholipid/cholesterol/gamma-HCH transport system substrate-binding protein [Solirubrobacteraceae bacterium]|nr:phospholipid/cholesterol/gamma-HCH transport system substrate-binding protein [Solirubrobacteraceae bacterium]